MIAKTTRVIFSDVFFSFHHQNPGESSTSTVPKKKRKRIWNVLPKNKKTFTHFFLFIYEVKYKQAKRVYLHTQRRRENLEITMQCTAEDKASDTT